MPDDPAIPSLGMQPKQWKAGTYTGICTLTFLAALFTMAKGEKEAKCSPMDEWTNKMS
jgi:hypothetical protein